MASDLDSANLSPEPEDIDGKSQWVKVGVVAAASAVAGGLAAAWWYRKTLARLQEAEDGADNTQISISERNSEMD
jgi:hypothetical protein